MREALRRNRLRACLAAALLLAPVRAPACALALIFALDVSASIDGKEYRQQRDGLAAALLDAGVQEAILAQPGGVAFAAYEWSGRYQQDMMLPWTAVTDRAGITGVSAAIAGHPRSYAEFPTAIGYALGYGAVLMRGAPDCTRRVIDISGDGIGNEGFGPEAAYREFGFRGITVNGLAIDPGDGTVLDYYLARIPHGEGAFIEHARGFADYAAAIRRKLLRELFGPQMVQAR
ncbi:DUF1194 domain-containing protein [Paralimibaculum aggregatum]|uniref:DUF1194 domain-containing protein n=1 Tax=Paralimibaculum aggregatum TaxID=3036245 RepID=A0ABQ6LR61_9RHOB|nr:DUF1194 domain-containing protein [Limibaculum sp. NKW23]GMG83410.1 DUF1194 domain-containing protein [Limibaculum sp. NKW23]